MSLLKESRYSWQMEKITQLMQHYYCVQSICLLELFCAIWTSLMINVLVHVRTLGTILHVTTSLTAPLVKQVIHRAYQNFDTKWEFLETGQDNVLNVAKTQSPDGNTICSRKRLHLHCWQYGSFFAWKLLKVLFSSCICSEIFVGHFAHSTMNCSWNSCSIVTNSTWFSTQVQITKIIYEQ